MDQSDTRIWKASNDPINISCRGRIINDDRFPIRKGLY
jgi:hypothetical protein